MAVQRRLVIRLVAEVDGPRAQFACVEDSGGHLDRVGLYKSDQVAERVGLCVLNLSRSENGLERFLYSLLRMEANDRVGDLSVIDHVSHERDVVVGTIEQDPREVPAVTR